MMKLLIIKNYLLLIDEKAEIKAGDIVVHNFGMGYEIEEPCDKDNLKSNTRSKIIAYYPLNSEAKELDLPLIPNPYKETLFEKINTIYSILSKRGFFKTQREDDSRVENLLIQSRIEAQSKQFSLEDMEDALNQLADKAEYGISNFAREDIITKIIQSLSTQQLPKEFTPEYKEVTCGCDSIPHNVIRTITNSNGVKVLVGTYKY